MFSKKIISWYLKNKRDLPWRNTRNPYKIWLSEIILQQTRIAQGLPYYYKFTEKYPSLEDLAKAEIDDVLRLWQGLGYYSRGRNLHFTAKQIWFECGGEFPESFEGLKKLKGIGNYTAAAIVSFAFGKKVPAIDGNALRVFSRIYGIDAPIDDSSTIKSIFGLASELIENVDPALFNQGIMELGATVCTPKSPKCDHCPVRIDCTAFDKKLQEKLPYKSKKIKVIDRNISYNILIFEDKIWLKQRGTEDIWAGLYDFFESELPEILSKKTISGSFFQKHILTHQRLGIDFKYIFLDEIIMFRGGRFYTISEIEELPKPKVIDDAFKRMKEVLGNENFRLQ